MFKAKKIFAIYLFSLFIFSLIFSRLELSGITFSFFNRDIEIKYMLIITILGGFLALKFSVSKSVLIYFSWIYSLLWVLKFILMYVAESVSEVHFMGKLFHLDIIILNYYSNISRLETPLPFLLIWLINSFFDAKKGQSENLETEQEIE